MAIGEQTLSRRALLSGSVAVMGGTGLLAACSSKDSPSSSGGGKVTFWNQSTGVDLQTFCTPSKTYANQHHSASNVCTGFADITKVQTSIASGSSPDLVQSWDYPVVVNLYSSGAIAALDPYMKKTGFDSDTILPGARKACVGPDGKYFALPDMAYAASNFFWDKDQFKAKGLNPEEPPKTLEDLLEHQSHFDVHKGGKLVKMGFNPRADVHPETWAFAFGGAFYDSTKREITPLDPGVVKGVEWLMRYADKYGASNIDRLNAGYGATQSAQNPILSAQVAMIGFWDALPAYRDRYAPKVSLGWSPFPYPADMPEQAGFGQLSFNVCFIPTPAKNPDGAWHLLEFIEEDVKTNVEVATKLSNTPQNVKAISSAQNTASPMLKKIQKYASSEKMQVFPPPLPVAGAYADAWSKQIDLIFAGKVQIRAGLQHIIDTVQPQLDAWFKSHPNG